MHHINKFDICYIIKLDQSTSEKTFFFNIEKSKLQKSGLIKKISKLPISIHHLSIELEFIVESKFIGHTNGHAIRYIYEWEQIYAIPYQYKVVFSPTSPPSTLHGTLCYIDENEVTTHTQIEEKIFEYLSISLSEPFKRNQRTIDVKELLVKDSLYNMATLLAFESNKYIFNYDDNSNVFNEEIIKLQSRTFDFILAREELKDFKNLNKFKSIITDFSIDNYFILNKEELTKSKLRKLIGNKEEAASLSETIILAKNSIFESDTENKKIENKELEKLIQEMDYIETLIGVYSCATFSSTLKTDCYVNDVYTYMNDLAVMERGVKYNRNVKVLTVKISDKLTRKSGKIIPYLENTIGYPLKIISNLPLEWIRVNRLPLMINFPVSRIPKTPVRVLENLTLERNFNISLGYEDLFQVLVISAFDDTDRLKGQLKSYIDDYILDPEVNDNHNKAMKDFINEGEQPFRFNIRFENVNDANELCDMLNNSMESIVIFDMHGDHKDDQEGFVLINGTRVSISTLFDKVTKIPPIVILSSCNTSAINRNSNTFSTGLLALGAFSVLGSALPINGHESARFITRLLLRIKLYLIEYFKRNELINWNNFIHGMIKREYFTDLINHLDKTGFVNSKEDKKEVRDAVGLILENYLEPNLMDVALKIICSITKSEFEKISKEVDENFFYAESIKYFHFGNPENIIISKSHPGNPLEKPECL